MRLVAGVDSSTQACKVVVHDAASGAAVRSGRSDHPFGTEVHPEVWWKALQLAVKAAGGLDDVLAVGVAAQQHGLVCLDSAGQVVPSALLWNETRSASAAGDLVAELGPTRWADLTGLVPLAAFTVSKLRWLAENEPQSLARTFEVCLPHDWLTWRLRGERDPGVLTTDRSDASGTGHFNVRAGTWHRELVELARRDDLPCLRSSAPTRAL